MFSLYEDCQRGVDLTLFCPLQCNDIITLQTWKVQSKVESKIVQLSCKKLIYNL